MLDQPLGRDASHHRVGMVDTLLAVIAQSEG